MMLFYHANNTILFYYFDDSTIFLISGNSRSWHCQEFLGTGIFLPGIAPGKSRKCQPYSHTAIRKRRQRDLLLLFLIRCDFIRQTPETQPDSADLATGNGRENKLLTLRKISAFFIYILCTQCERNYLKYL